MTWSKPRVFIALLVTLLTCAPSTAAGAQTVAQVVVKSLQLRVKAGARAQILTEVYDDANEAVPPDRYELSFTSADTMIATVSITGEVIGVRPGSTRIFVRAGKIVRQVQVSVTAATAQPVAPPPATVPRQTAPPATPPATAPASAPATAPVTSPAAATPTVTPSATATRPVPPAGGSPAVSATIEPGNIRLLPGERFRPTFRLVLANGSQVDASDVTWTPYGAAVGIDPGTNDVIGVLPGSGVLGGRSALGNVSASVPVVVGEAVLVPEPDSLVLSSGLTDTVYLVAPAQDRRRVTQNLAWSSTDPTVLRVVNPAFGIVEAGGVGTADLIVQGYTLTRRIPIRVTPRISRIDVPIVAGTEIPLGVGGSTTLDAKAFGTAGELLPPDVMMWRVADPTMARVTASGTIVGVREGRTTLSLLAPGVPTQSWPVTVREMKVSARERLLSLTAGTSRTLAVTLRARDQSDLGALTAARWVSTAPDVATVDAAGTLTAKAPGRATVVVSQDGAGADSITVFVTGRALVSGTINGVRGIWQVVTGTDSTATLLMRTDSGAVSQAVWSPDRTHIAATYEPLDRVNASRVVVMDADGRNWKTVSADSVMASDPAWAPDGRSLFMAVRNPKAASILRVTLATGASSSIRQVGEGQLRYPAVGADTADLLVRIEANGAVDLARVHAGALTLLTRGRPREELFATLRDGRMLLAIDSSSRTRPTTLVTATPAADGMQSVTPVTLPAGFVITDISRGYDDTSVLVAGRARLWPGLPGQPLLLLRVPLDGTAPQVLLVLTEKDVVTVRTN